MFDAAYRRRLEGDLPRWRETGWVTADGAAAILASLGAPRPAIGLAGIVATLGALLLGLGVIAFVGANWEAMPRIVRFALLVAVLAAAYLAAGLLRRRGMRLFAEAALLVAGLVFAGAIALVGQTYHLSGDFTDAILLWVAGVLIAALLTGSRTMTVLALIGAGYWTWSVTWYGPSAPHLAGVIPILIGGALATWQDSRYGRVVAVLAFGAWLALSIFGAGWRFDLSFAGTVMLAATVAFAVWAAAVALSRLTVLPRLAALGEAALWPATVSSMLALGTLQIVGEPASDPPALVVLSIVAVAIAAVLAAFAWLRQGLGAVDAAGAPVLGLAAVAFAMLVPEADLWARLAGGAIVIAATLWAVNLGHGGRIPAGKSTGLAAFGIEVIYLYIATLGTLLDTAVAFLAGGVLFFALAWGLYRIDRRLGARATAGGAA